MTEHVQPQLAKLRLHEWQSIQARAKAYWKTHHLGVRPTFKQVKDNLPNPHTISILEWLAMVVLVVLTAFTSYKVGALAVPFATKTLETLTTQTTDISLVVQHSFILVTAVLFMLLATPSLIYFKLLADEPEIRAEKKDTRALNLWGRLSLEYLTPRLPSIIVYLSVGWLVLISSSLPGTWFEKYLPVVVEVGLAALVGNIIAKRKKFNAIVWAALRERTEPYDARLIGYETEPLYLRTLYQTMREELAGIRRPDPATRKERRVNDWLEQAEESVVYKLVSAEYRRLTSGNQFAHDVTSGVVNTDPTATPSASPRRHPPAGERVWTPETLADDLRVRGIDPEAGYNEARLQTDYDKNHKPRAAWRAGGRELFFGN